MKMKFFLHGNMIPANEKNSGMGVFQSGRWEGEVPPAGKTGPINKKTF